MKLKPLGVKGSELHSYPEATVAKDSDGAKHYPEIRVEGKHAELLGAADLEAGGTAKLVATIEVKSLRKTSENGKDRYEMTLCLKKAALEDIDEADDDEDEEEDEDEGEDEGKTHSNTAALAYIEKAHRG